MDPALKGSDGEVGDVPLQHQMEALKDAVKGLEKEDRQDEGEEEDSGDGKKRKKAWRVMLAPESAIEIYKRRPPLDEANGKYPHGSMRSASQVAVEYNVSPKTIRDIWNRYSWAKVTRSLWTEQEAIHYSTTYPVRGHQGTGVLSEVAAKNMGAMGIGMRMQMGMCVGMGGQNCMVMGGGVAHRPPMVGHFQHQQYMQQMPPSHPHQHVVITHPQQQLQVHQQQHHQQQPQQQYHQQQQQHMGSWPAPAYNNNAPAVSSNNNSQSQVVKRMRCDAQAPPQPQCQWMNSGNGNNMFAANSTADDIGIGSIDQITQFNDEVDQIVGQLPIGLFPSANGVSKDMAAQKLGGDDGANLFLNNMPGLSRSEQHHPHQQQPYYGVSGVHEMVQHLLMGVATPQGVPPSTQQQQPEPALNDNGNLEEQIGAARNRLNQLLALSKQQNNSGQHAGYNGMGSAMANSINSGGMHSGGF